MQPLLVWILAVLAAAESETYTVFSFSRKINTCDPLDRPLEEATSKIIWAYNDNDPSPSGAVPKHTNMGSQSVRFFSQGELPPLPDNTVPIDVTIGGETLITFDNPAHPTGTNYWCSTHKIAAPNLFDTKKHLVRIDPIIDPRYIKQVHHILAYLCKVLTEEELEFSQSCYDGNMPTSLQNCLNGELIAGWAVGGTALEFPPNAGMPFGPTDAAYVLMETHFDNPTLVPIYDNSGFRLWFSPDIREFDAGIGYYGHIVSSVFTIPKGQAAYKYEAWATPECTNTYPPDGITVIGASLHTHVIGKAAKLQQFRNGVELPPILEEPYYDFNYQDFTQFYNRTIKIMPGDYIRTECTYNSLYRNTDTIMGLSTSDEMCLAYFIYYPKWPTVGTLYGDYGGSTGKLATCGEDLTFTQLTIPPVSDFVTYVPPPCPYVAPETSRMTPTLRTSLIKTSDYERSAFLDSDNKIQLFWTIDRVNLVFHAALQGKTTGWVGFGISAFGMEGADVTIGWVNNNNEIFFADRFATQKAEPPIDVLQDYYDIQGGQITVDDSSSSPLLTRTQLYIVGAISGAVVVLLVVGVCYWHQRRKSAPFGKLVPDDSEDSSIPM